MKVTSNDKLLQGGVGVATDRLMGRCRLEVRYPSHFEHLHETGQTLTSTHMKHINICDTHDSTTTTLQ